MDFKEKNPLVLPVTFQDAPEKAVSEYFESKSREIKILKMPSWDEVPSSPAQTLQEASRGLEATRSEFEESRCEQQRRLSGLQHEWRHLEQLQRQLKDCFLHTEQQIKGLGEGEVAAPGSEEARAAAMQEREAWLETRASELQRASHRIEDETRRLAPYKEFVCRVSEARRLAGQGTSGAEAVLQQYERLCAVQAELETRQSAALAQLQDLRSNAQTFTAQALSKLDAQQAQVAALKEQVKIQTAQCNVSGAQLLQLRSGSQVSDAEEGQLRAAVRNLYEQLWRRYHPKAVLVPPRSIAGQASYVQHTLAALQSLVDARKKSKPTISASLQPQFSRKS